MSRLQSSLHNAERQIIDANNSNRKTEYRPGWTFLIGGNRLECGDTTEGLAVSYYPREAKTNMMTRSTSMHAGSQVRLSQDVATLRSALLARAHRGGVARHPCFLCKRLNNRTLRSSVQRE